LNSQGVNKNMKTNILHDTPVAIIGQAAVFAKAASLTEYWDNILNKIDGITDVPDSRWNPDDYYDPDPLAEDKTYCKRGGFIPDIEFNPLEFGLPPNILEVTDSSQLLGLIVARDAMEDAGYKFLPGFIGQCYFRPNSQPSGSGWNEYRGRCRLCQQFGCCKNSSQRTC
jgi:hypothetical protein